MVCPSTVRSSCTATTVYLPSEMAASPLEVMAKPLVQLAAAAAA